MKVLILNLRAIYARSYVRIVGQNRELSWIFFDVFLPLLGIAAYVYIYQNLGAKKEFSGFVILGGAMTAFWLNVLWGMASNFYWEKEMGNLELFLIAPMSRMSILLGMAVGGMYNSIIRSLSAFILGSFIFQVPFKVASWGKLTLIFFLTLFALYGLGMLGSSLYLLYGREAWHTSNLIQDPVFLVSGFYFPVKSLGFWISSLASLIPITLGLDGMRQILYGKEFALMGLNWEIFILFFLTIIYIYLAYFSLNFLENLAKKEGRLTLRWQ